MQCFAHLKKYNCKAQQQCKRVRDNTRQVQSFETLRSQAYRCMGGATNIFPFLLCLFD